MPTIEPPAAEGITSEQLVEKLTDELETVRAQANNKIRSMRREIEDLRNFVDEMGGRVREAEDDAAEAKALVALMPPALRTALDLVHGDRQSAYGHPLDNHGATGLAWTGYVMQRFNRLTQQGRPFQLDAKDVCELNKLQKSIRFAWTRKADSSIDSYGYQLNEDMIDEEMERRLLADIEEIHGGE